ncbi:MAG: glycosyltransferase, partial [Bacteroidota bacterium]
MHTERITVIIPVRNEEGNISQILQDLECQKLDKSQFDVIVVDDHSSDTTCETVRSIISRSKLTISLIELADFSKISGKKSAISEGVKHAATEIIFTTDADCRLQSRMLEVIRESFGANTKLLAGPVQMIGKGVFHQMQALEFSLLMSVGAVTIEKNIPVMCSGANLSFRRSVFLEVGGYSDNLHIPSGDDEFLLYSIWNKFGDGLAFLKSSDAIVTTPSHRDLSSFWNQRIRWTSKWKTNRNSKVQIAAICFFLDQLFFLSALLMTFLGMFDWLLVATIFIVRVIPVYLLTRNLKKLTGSQYTILSLIFLQIFYPLHTLMMGLASIFGTYT